MTATLFFVCECGLFPLPACHEIPIACAEETFGGAAEVHVVDALDVF